MDDLIPGEHLRIEVITRHPGGQYVGGSPGVKVTHVPSGLTVSVDCERSQHRNRAIAMAAIEGALTSPAYRGRL